MKRTVTVVGSASVSVEPDCARLQCGVQVAGSNAQDALRRSNSAAQSILATLRGHGVSAADVRTNGPNLYPTDAGYAGSNDVTVVIRNIDAVGDVIDAVAAAGGPNLTMHGVSFSVSDRGLHVPAARAAAMEAAGVIAAELAAAAGAAVGEVVTISEGSGGMSPVPVARAQMLKSTPVEPGAQEIVVDVTVTYRLIDAKG
jgi:uncharacterized protein